MRTHMKYRQLLDFSREVRVSYGEGKVKACQCFACLRGEFIDFHGFYLISQV